MSIVRVDRASFRRGGRTVLSGVTFAVEPGEAVALVGPNGAGKSTLLDGLLGLVPHDADRFEVPTGAGAIGMLAQSTTTDPAFPISLEQVVMQGRIARLGLRWPGRADREAVAAALDTVRLTAHRKARFGDLSGGQQRRGLLARAIAGEPALLLLDEPFNGLDAASRQSLLDAIERLKARGVGLVVTTHDLELARAVCERTLLVDREQVAFDDTACVLTLEQVRATFEHHAVEIDGHTLATAEHHAAEHGHVEHRDHDER
ncbi:metal ABC transporter ATP-binding protein [Agrococcus sp. SGAir0287]|uniref:metal ABC transporter ATP-binding protein n=1 Tax=Agrococcus sp. SGAir0287 TaxID=2070347 RepID=UPI0010CCD0AF|nr:ATP-binding cassette domain-containing protein [Agrococcus sp. SGAir0287]QCR20470.1 ABC transporter ATP-binding protein [Agrococcus sp. SGAir0287]